MQNDGKYAYATEVMAVLGHFSRTTIMKYQRSTRD